MHRTLFSKNTLKKQNRFGTTYKQAFYIMCILISIRIAWIEWHKVNKKRCENEKTAYGKDRAP